MATFGTGPFSSDGAMDFLEELAERPREQRAPALERLFRLVTEEPHLLWRDFFPDEVVAAAAVVAAALPGGRQFDENGGVDAPAPQLANLALEALLVVAGPEGPWHQGWTTDADAAQARDTIAAMRSVLAVSDSG